MDIEPIKTQRDYRRVLKEIEGLASGLGFVERTGCGMPTRSGLVRNLEKA